MSTKNLVFRSDARLDPGIKRKYKPNEDSLLAVQGLINGSSGSQSFGLFVIADGMGGHANGQDASRLAIQMIVENILPKLVTDTAGSLDYAKLLVDGIQSANQAVHQQNMDKRSDMGTTITSALVVRAVAYVANVGDSRTYLYTEAKGLQKVTNDHSVVASLVEAGSKDDVVDLINIAIEELVRQRLELPAFSAFERTAKRIRAQTASTIYKHVADTLTQGEKEASDRLFIVDIDKGESLWNQLKVDPENPTLSHLEELMQRASWLTGLQIGTDALTSIPQIKIQRFATEALALDANRMKDMQICKRHTLALSLVRVQRAQALDDVAEMFIKRLLELGRVIRTGFLLQYLGDPELRATIQRATNKSESFNNFAKWIAFGNAGVIPTNNRREMRKYLKYNHLLANIMIFANVALLSQAINELAREGHPITADAVAALSPYITEHIIRFGLYQVDRNRQPKPLMYEVSLPDPENVLQAVNVVVRAG